MIRAWTVLVLATASLLTGAVVPATAAVPAAAPKIDHNSDLYQPVRPQRVLDTRAGRPIAAGQTVTVDLTGLVPSGTDAVVLNVTATNVTASGYLSVNGALSSLNTTAGQTRAISVTAEVAADGTGQVVQVRNSAGTADAVVDLLGYYEQQGNESTDAYYPTDAVRLFDSRESGGALRAGETADIGLEVGLTDVAALAVDITAVTPRGAGYLRAWDGGRDVPATSTLNFAAGQTVPNFAIVPVRTGTCEEPDGPCSAVSFSVQNNVSSSTQVLVDVVGVYARDRQRGATLFSPTNVREIDSRRGSPLGAGHDDRLAIAHPYPGTEDRSVAANVTLIAVRPTRATYLTLFRYRAARPDTSDLNPTPGSVQANTAQVLVDLDARSFVALYNNAGAVDVVVDVNGRFYAEDPGAARTAGPRPTRITVDRVA